VVGIASRMARASSTVSTGVLPLVTTYFGPRTAGADSPRGHVAGHHPA
jgi:hypothetical protein